MQVMEDEYMTCSKCHEDILLYGEEYVKCFNCNVIYVTKKGVLDECFS